MKNLEVEMIDWRAIVAEKIRKDVYLEEPLDLSGAFIMLSDYRNCKHVCEVRGHTTNYEWAIWRHIDNKHPDALFELCRQAHGWNDARNGWV